MGSLFSCLLFFSLLFSSFLFFSLLFSSLLFSSLLFSSFLFSSLLFSSLFSLLFSSLLFSSLLFSSLLFSSLRFSPLLRMMAGKLEPDEGSGKVPELNISYKPQKISPKSQGTVRQLLHDKIRDAYVHPQFVADVMRPLKVEEIMDQEVQNLSGGELQRLAMALCLGKPADVYLIDEPSAYLDSEQRLVAAKVIKRFILHAKKTGFVVEHDFIMATYLADRVIVFEGTPSIDTTACSPQSLLTGMNKFLKQLEIAFRRDPNNYRPRINKLASQNDAMQKASGNYFFLED